jgi:hypothetical protein
VLQRDLFRPIVIGVRDHVPDSSESALREEMEALLARPFPPSWEITRRAAISLLLRQLGDKLGDLILPPPQLSKGLPLADG